MIILLEQPNIFKTPMVVSQTINLSKGCSTGYATGGGYYDKDGNFWPYSCGGFSCEPYGSKGYIDCSYCGSFTAGVIGGGVVVTVGGAAIIIFT